MALTMTINLRDLSADSFEADRDKFMKLNKLSTDDVVSLLYWHSRRALNNKDYKINWGDDMKDMAVLLKSLVEGDTPLLTQKTGESYGMKGCFKNKKCTICGELGHDKRRCPRITGEPAENTYIVDHWVRNVKTILGWGYIDKIDRFVDQFKDKSIVEFASELFSILDELYWKTAYGSGPDKELNECKNVIKWLCIIYLVILKR